jgi:hypothetical protein
VAPAPSAPDAGGKTAQENVRFETSGIPGLPEKFLRDGKPDIEALVTSYVNLEKTLGTKPDELKTQWEAERLAKRPEAADKYELPKNDAFDPDELAAHPLTAWWRKQAFERGLTNEEFQAGIAEYAESAQPSIDFEGEMKKLGDNANQRVTAVAAWISKFKDKPGAYDRLEALTADAEGVELLEQIMGTAVSTAGGAPAPAPAITAESVRSMQNDPRYWDAGRRDPAFVKQVEDAYARLYPSKS